MSTFDFLEQRDMIIGAAVNQALNRAINEVPARAAIQNGSLPGEPIVNGTFNDDNEFVQYEIVGDVVGVKPVGP